MARSYNDHAPHSLPDTGSGGRALIDAVWDPSGKRHAKRWRRKASRRQARQEIRDNLDMDYQESEDY